MLEQCKSVSVKGVLDFRDTGAVGGGIEKARRRERRKGGAKRLCINITTARVISSTEFISLLQRRDGPKRVTSAGW